MLKKYFLLSIILSALFMSNCTRSDKDKLVPLKVFVSIIPQKYFVKKIGQGRVEVDVLVGPGKSPATYEPSPDQILSLRNAKILFTIGVPFEQGLLPKIKSSLKSLTVVDTSHGINKRFLDSHHHDEHGGEGNEHEDEHADGEQGKVTDPHIWLSPVLARKLARTIYSALVKSDPEGKEVYIKGYSDLLQELDEVHSALQKQLSRYKGKTIFVFHPAFGYFTDEYGLKQVAVEFGGKEPTPAMLHKIITYAKKEKVKIVFVQPEFSKKSAETIAAAIGGAVIMLNPLNEDYINNLKNIADKIKEGL